MSPDEIQADARQLLAQARGHQLAEARKQLGIGQKDIAAAMGVSIARVSQIEHGTQRRTIGSISAFLSSLLAAAWLAQY